MCVCVCVCVCVRTRVCVAPPKEPRLTDRQEDARETERASDRRAGAALLRRRGRHIGEACDELGGERR